MIIFCVVILICDFGFLVIVFWVVLVFVKNVDVYFKNKVLVVDYIEV